MWDTHYVLQNCRSAHGADIIVILQRQEQRPRAFEVLLVQAKFCATHASASRNARPPAIESEMLKALVATTEVAANTVPKWRTRNADNSVVKPYFALVQRLQPGPGVGPVAPSEAGTKVRETHAAAGPEALETSGVWFVSASAGGSALFPASSDTADAVVRKIVYHGCDAFETRAPALVPTARDDGTHRAQPLGRELHGAH
jgi:hypothetical protein